MAAWLVTEDPQQLIRVDSIVHVNPVAVFDEGDPTAHEATPKGRLTAANHVEIIVSTLAGQQVRALTCPGYAAWAATAELTYMLAGLAGKYEADSTPVYVYGPRGSQARWDRALWTVSEQIPEPDYLPYW